LVVLRRRPLATVGLAAGLTLAAAWASMEVFAYDALEPEAFELRAIGRQAAAIEPVYFLGFSKPMLSFYAGKVIPMVDSVADLVAALPEGGEAHVILRNEAPALPPELGGELVVAADDLQMWRVTRGR
jgi:hypothetical protein